MINENKNSQQNSMPTANQQPIEPQCHSFPNLGTNKFFTSADNQFKVTQFQQPSPNLFPIRNFKTPQIIPTSIINQFSTSKAPMLDSKNSQFPVPSTSQSSFQRNLQASSSNQTQILFQKKQGSTPFFNSTSNIVKPFQTAFPNQFVQQQNQPQWQQQFQFKQQQQEISNQQDPQNPQNPQHQQIIQFSQNLLIQNQKQIQNKQYRELKVEILGDENEIVAIIVLLFNDLSLEAQTQFFLQINQNFRSLKKLRGQDQKQILDEHLEEFQVAENENFQELFDSLIQQEAWEEILKQFQNCQFRKELNIPNFWVETEYFNVMASEQNVLSKLLKLIQLESYKQNADYGTKLLFWFDLLSEMSKLGGDEKLIFEQIVGSSLLKYISYFQKFRQKDSRYDWLIQDLCREQSITELEDYFKNQFQIQQEQLDYSLLKNKFANLIMFSSIEVSYFKIIIYFLKKYKRRENFLNLIQVESPKIEQYNGENENIFYYIIKQQFEKQPIETTFKLSLINRIHTVKLPKALNDPKIEQKITLFNLLQQENPEIIFKIIEEQKSANLYDLARNLNLESENGKLQVGSIIYLFLLIALIYNHSESDLKYFQNFYYLNNTFEKVDSIEYIINLNKMIDQNQLDNIKIEAEGFNQATQQNWANFEQVFGQEFFQTLYSKLENCYLNIQSDQLQAAVYQIQINLNQKIKKNVYQKHYQLNIQNNLIFQDGGQLMQQQFDQLWQNEVQQFQEQQEKQFLQNTIDQYYKIFSTDALKSNQNSEVLQYFLKSSKRQLNDKNEIEMRYFKEKILKSNQFIPIVNTDKNKIYYEIFSQPLSNRLRKSHSTFIIDINNFYQQIGAFYIISDKELINYLKNDQFYYDFRDQMNRKKQYGITQQNMQNQVNQIQLMVTDFLWILDDCEFAFDQKTLEQLKQFSLNSNNWEKIGESRVIFQDFQNSIAITKDTKRIVYSEQEENFRKMYPSLNCQEIYFYSENGNQLKAQYKEYSNYFLFYRNQQYKSKYQQQSRSIEINETEILDYIQNQQIYSHLENKFIVQQPKFVENILNGTDGWKIIYSDVYDLIKQQIARYDYFKDQDQIFQADEHLISFEKTLVQQKIIEYNKQFANIGVIFSDEAEQCIYHFADLILWKFSNYTYWRELQKQIQKFEGKKNELQQEYLAEIKGDFSEISKNVAKKIYENIKFAFLDAYQVSNVSQSQYLKPIYTKTCMELVKELDQQLLLNQQNPENKDIKNQGSYLKVETLRYILDQGKFIQYHTEFLLVNAEKQLQQEYQEKLRVGLKNYLLEVQKNIKNLSSLSQSQELIQECKIQLKKTESKVIGVLSITLNGKLECHPFFEQKYQQGICSKIEQLEMKIPQLQLFFQELDILFENELKNDNQIQLVTKQFNFQSHLNQIRFNLIGCLKSCPFCRRKCDQPNNNEHKHSCSNGHYLRGMNGVLINYSNKPSPFTCEEINDNTLITTSDFYSVKKWKDYKLLYNNWNFHADDFSIQKPKQQMRQVWNSGVGQLICQYFSQKLNIEVPFEEINDQEKYLTCHQSIHYLLMLDDSGSMSGEAWDQAKAGALQCMNKIGLNNQAKVSVIIFNTSARVVIDCETFDNKDAIQANKIDYIGGGTSFDSAFLMAFDQIMKHFSKKFKNNIILFYTDGADSYPETAIEQFCQLSEPIKQAIQLVSFSKGGSENDSLQQITEKCKRSGITAERYQKVDTEILSRVWGEVIFQNYHNLKE